MPVTKSRTYLMDTLGFEDSNNTAGFLFGDEDSNSSDTRATPTGQGQANNSDTFNTIFRQQAGFSNMVSFDPGLNTRLLFCS